MAGTVTERFDWGKGLGRRGHRFEVRAPEVRRLLGDGEQVAGLVPHVGRPGRVAVTAVPAAHVLEHPAANRRPDEPDPDLEAEAHEVPGLPTETVADRGTDRVRRDREGEHVVGPVRLAG